MQQHTIPTPYMVGDVHIYTAEIEGELVLFDTGPSTAAGIDYLRRHVDLRRLRHVLVTHCHIDHYGLAGWLGEHSEAQIYLPRKDDLKLRHHQRRVEHLQQLLLGCGFTADFVAAFRSSLSGDQVFPPEPKRYTVAEEADLPGRLGISILPCPGHSQSDLVYRWGNYAVTGDVLLRGNLPGAAARRRPGDLRRPLQQLPGLLLPACWSLPGCAVAGFCPAIAAMSPGWTRRFSPTSAN